MVSRRTLQQMQAQANSYGLRRRQFGESPAPEERPQAVNEAHASRLRRRNEEKGAFEWVNPDE